MRKITVSLFVFCLILIIENAAAVPASPYPFTLVQPDGYSFQARQYGDERIHWIETLDGYTIVKDSNGYWTYAAKNNDGKLIPTIDRVGMVEPLSMDIEKHVTPIWKPDDIMIRKSSPRPVKIKTLDLQANGVSGIASVTTEKVVVILINFTDVSQESIHDKTYYDNLIFNDSTGANSMFNYYREVSYDQLTITGTTVSKWYQSSHTMEYYGTDTDPNIDTDDYYTDIFNLAREAVQLADPDIDFSEYDTDSDGVVDHVIIVHAGGAQESSEISTDIWSHKWSIWNYYNGDWHEDGEIVDGVRVIDYTMLAEGSPLGTFAHEFFHDLGAPDLYDYDTGADEGYPVQDWDLMAYGSWANLGNTPTHMGGYLKWDIDADPTNGINGWLTPTTVSTPQTVAIDRLELSTGNRLFKVDIPETNQYFLIENRQQTGYDAYLPEAGILIWHIDEDMISYYNDIKDDWVDLNDGPPWNPYYRAWVEDPGNTSSKDGAAYSSDDGQTSFNQTTIPNNNKNDGSPSGIKIYNIGAEGSSMLVTFFNTAPSVTVTSPNGGETISCNMTITWTHSDIDPTDTHTFTIKLSSDGGTTYPTLIVSGLGESVSSYVYNTTDMPDGSNYKVQVIATDNYTMPLSGNDSSDGVFTIDNHPPALIGNPTGYPAGQTAAKNGSQITLNVTIIDEGVGIKNATVDASQINASLMTPLILEKVNDYWINQSVIVNAVDGVYYLPVTVYDNASNSNTSSVVQVTVDNTPPAVISNPTSYPDGLSAANNGTRIILNASISDTLAGVKNATVNISQINSSFGDIQLTNINGFWINDSVIVRAPDGTYFLNITAYDNAGNMNDTVNLSVKVDNSYPVINAITLNTTTPNAGDDILITVNATDNVAVTSVEANGIQLTHQGGDIWNGSITAKADHHIIYIMAIDAAGLIEWNHSVTYFANNTPIGTNVQAEIPKIGATITFTNVIKSGQTYISEFKDDPSPPTGYNVLSNYYDIVTTAEYTGDITICIDYTESESDNENYIKILHYEEKENEKEIFALMQENISVGDTVWDLNGTTYPDVLYGGSSESLHFVIDGTRLEINKSNFEYNTSIYDENGEHFIAWLDEPMFVIESGGDWNLTKMLINDTHEDTYSLMVDNTMHLLEGFAVTLLEINVSGEEAWISITKDGEEVKSHVVEEGKQFIYEEDLNESGDDDNWVLRFYLENVSLDSNSIKINKTQLISPNLTIIRTPDDKTITNFSIHSINENTLGIRLDASDDIISLEKGGVVNLIGDKFRFKLDENGNTGGVLKRSDVTGLWQDVTSSLDTDTNIVCGVVTNLSDFVIVDTTPPPSNGNGRGGGGGGGGGGSSGEDYYNIVLSETDRQSVYKNSHISYRFDLEGNIVKHINFTALKSAGTIAAKVEILNNTSTLVSTLPPHEVFRNLNIWVGNAGWATNRNIADATVVFTVEKSWITKNNIDESSIALYRYSDDTWHKLVTRKIAEDANSLQFEAETPGFSPFAVTGKTMGEPGGEGIIEPTVTAEKTPAPTPTEEKGIPGFGLFAGLSVLLIAVELLRKKK